MSNIRRAIVFSVLAMLVASCAVPATNTPSPSVMPEVRIVRYPAPAVYKWMNNYDEPPTYDPNSAEQWQVDLRSSNLTNLDLSKSMDDLLYADFDSQTQWPPVNKMPVDFDWQKITEINKDPGLSIRALHSQGITGKGIGIAIIDQTLLVNHIEYKDRIRVYEEDMGGEQLGAEMHGAAVASIAVGQTAGVAPDADLYYIATSLVNPSDSSQNLDYSYYARALRRIIEINKELPKDQRIRVASMSIGLNPAYAGYDNFLSAIEEAKAAGIFAISVSLDRTYGWNIWGLGRDSRSDPNNFQSYEPASWLRQQFWERGIPAQTLLIPMDSRTTASPTGKEDYVFYRQGGMSWTIPYLAGMYALAVQVKPDITPQEFWKTALKTGRTIQLQHDGKDYEFGIILDPQALIEAIKTK